MVMTKIFFVVIVDAQTVLKTQICVPFWLCADSPAPVWRSFLRQVSLCETLFLILASVDPFTPYRRRADTSLDQSPFSV
jgi:hypothetical protein